MLRKILFWSHLTSGVVVGLVVALMSITGVALAFQPQIEAWLRAGLFALDPVSARLPLEEIRRLAEADRGEPATAVTLSSEPDAAVAVHFGRTEVSYLHPQTGERLVDPAEAWARRFATLREWHRWLGAKGESRVVGRAITGASNLIFVFLIVSGLYLWFPRRWTRRALAGVTRLRFGVRGRARDWNWHHAIGFWSLPVLLVLAVSGVAISYEWAHRLVFVVAGSEPPPPGRPAPPRIDVAPPPEGAKALPLDALARRVKEVAPAAREVRLILGPPARAGENAPALHASIRERGAFPPFASLGLSLDPYRGDVLRYESFADQEPGKRLRGWLRFLHTGEALGWPGQLAAASASAGAVVLVWTGIALSIRRLARSRRKARSRGPGRAVAIE